MNTTKIIENEFEIEVNDLIPEQEISHHVKLKKFLHIAKNLSELSEFDIYRFGAVITFKDKIIASGYNSPKSHPMQKHYNNKFKEFVHDNSQHGIHAEMAALNELKHMMKTVDFDLKKVEMTVYRSGKDGNSKMGRPCAACMAAIKEFGIPVVNYTTPHGIATEFIIGKDLKVKKAKRLI